MALMTATLRTQSSARPRSRRVLLGVVGVVSLLTLLEIVPLLGLVDEQYLPPVSVAGGELLRLLIDPAFLVAIGSTLATWFLGLTVAALIAIPLGTLLGLSDFTYHVTRAAVDLIRPLPPIALIPLLILVLGQTLEMKVALVVFGAVWPVLFNTISGVRDVDPQLRQMARTFQLSGPTIIRRIVIPSAAPFMATGVRIASSIALIVVVTVEMIAGGASGLGAYIAEARAIGTEVPRVFAGTLMTGVLGLLINSALRSVESKLFAWHERSTAQ